MSDSILLICLGPQGRLLNAFSAMERVRYASPQAHLVLLTHPGLAGLARRAPWLDEIVTVEMASADLQIGRLAKSIRQEKFRRIIDLQRDADTERLFAAFGLFPPAFASHAPRAKWRREDAGHHPVEEDKALLDLMGMADNDADLSAGPDLSWLVRTSALAPSQEPAYFGLTDPYILLNLVPETDADGGWPDSYMLELVSRILQQGIMVAITGGVDARERAKPLLREFPNLGDLCARADPFQLAGIGAQARCVIGFASGTMQLCAASGTRCISIHANHEDAARNGVRTPNGVTLVADPLYTLTPDSVMNTLAMFGAVSQH